jgi:hypothetical protein
MTGDSPFAKLRRAVDRWSAEAAIDADGGAFDERAAILEHDGGFDRAEAERRAADELGVSPDELEARRRRRAS